MFGERHHGFSGERRHPRAAARLAVAAGVGAAGGLAAGLLAPATLAALLAWDLTALTHLLLTWPAIWKLHPEQTRRHASAEDNTQGWTDALLLSAALASLLGLILLLVGSSRTGGTRIGYLSVGFGGVLLSWTLVHTLFTLRYARLYYDEEDGGVNFNQQDPPAYSDFAYLAFTVAMTFQVSDTALTNRQMRATALRHALISYLFGAVIVAMTVNLLAGLSR
jgi:uncharacterized membrane protein